MSKKLDQQKIIFLIRFGIRKVKKSLLYSKMVSNWAKFRLLMWKNCLIQYRHPIQTVFEVLLPALFGVILIVVRALVVPTTHTNTTVFQSFDIDTLNPLR